MESVRNEIIHKQIEGWGTLNQFLKKDIHLCMESYASHQTADLTKENERLKSELRVSSDVNTLIKENIWLKSELVKMQDSLTSCQGELQSLQNKHRNLREMVCKSSNHYISLSADIDEYFPELITEARQTNRTIQLPT